MDFKMVSKRQAKAWGMTDRQRGIATALYQGYTCVEIAKAAGFHVNTIYKDKAKIRLILQKAVSGDIS